jgi:hypothetical protein
MRKRIWSTFTMLTLGAVLALGVGTFIHQSEVITKAAAEDWVELTDISGIEDGEKYAITRLGYYIKPGSYSSSPSAHSFSLATATENDAWTFVEAGEGSNTWKITDGTNWLKIEATGTTALRANDTAPTTYFTALNVDGEDTVRLQTSFTENRHIALYEPTPDWRTYNASGAQINFSKLTLYKYAPGEGEVIPVTGVELNKSATSIDVGFTEQLTATVSPGNASEKGVTWESTNEAAATVSSTGLVTAVSVGQATVRVKTDDGDFEDECIVTVTEGPTYYSTKISSSGLTLDTPIDLMSKGLDWTFSMEGSDLIFTGDGRGVQFGSATKPANVNMATYVSITSELFVVSDDALIKKIIVYGETASGGSFDVDVYVNGEEFDDTISASYVGASGPQEFVFENSEGMFGHIQILFTNTFDYEATNENPAEQTGKALYFHSVKVYADEDANLAAALNFANNLEGFKTCSEATAAHTALSGAYDSLTPASKTYLDSIKLFDYDAGDTTYAGSMSLQVTAADKWAGILAVHTGAWPSAPSTLLGSGLLNYTLMSLLAIIGITLITGGAYYIMLRKKKIII